ncbi:MAG: hypothetical protein A2X93_00890 [Deltaproteobacteria bacterium GWC2_56_8]|nr:MAG: hypothetical protein A2X99_09520 [Deltaproteobacteria bacterium GWB2_55_19]OGP38748.1 MAG: hypothetical protein A2X93_00890 [Deltaproteobacteria bacterium GWC2_56_8]HAO93809.1 DUF523 domain-containing protein [Deltaproteobacteria bacterium]
MTKTVIVSACLLGLKTRYDGNDALNAEVLKELNGAIPIPVCPEVLGGLPTPRPKAEIDQGDGASVLEGSSRVVDEKGRDCTAEFIRGALAVLEIARLTGAREAFLKEKSPSCGVALISKKGGQEKGLGVTAALLKKDGVEIKGF